MLKNNIRKSLLETKERKERLLIERKLIENRLSIIVERVKTKDSFKSQSKKNQLKISAKFIQELSYLKNVGLLNEANLTNSLQSIFGNSFGNITETMFEPILNVILKKLGFGDGSFKNFIVSSLTSSPIDLVDAFSDCKVMTKLLVKSIIEAQVMVLQTETGLSGVGLNFMRNTLGSLVNDERMVKELEDKFSMNVCELINNFIDKAESITDTLKGNVPNTMDILNKAIA
jgi:hypothetical protein